MTLLAGCAKKPGADIIARVRSGHPRLLMTPDTLAAIRANLPVDPWLLARYRRQKQRADRYLTQPPAAYELKGTDGLVDASRLVLERVSTLALVYRLEGDRKYLDRCWQELVAADHFPDWNQARFLSTAELTAAFAIAYDWLYDAWTPDQRELLRRDLVDSGLKPGLAAYDSQRWSSHPDNHNIVNNGGLAMGALALADEYPGLCGAILARGLASAPICLAQFGPDGAWPEGPVYWGYETEYTSLYLDSLETACGTDFGLGDIPGLSEGGWFPFYMNGPANGPFNFGDADEERGATAGAQLLWMAQRFHDPRYAQYEVEHPDGRMSVMEVIWGAGAARAPWQTLPTDRYFRGVEVATMRDRWNDPQAWFVGLKAGSKDASHNHLDLGSFILEAKGVRWALDLGGDNPDLPGYSHDDDDGMRWTYYRLRAEGHNTLVINPGGGADQNYKASGKITSFVSTPQGVELTADLTAAYPAANRVVRSLSYVRGKSTEVSDTIELKQSGEVAWFLQTRADIRPSPDGRTLFLSQAGRTLTLKLLQPTSARFETAPAGPLPSSPHPPVQAANPGVTRIEIHLLDVRSTVLAVRFES